MRYCSSVRWFARQGAASSSWISSFAIARASTTHFFSSTKSSPLRHHSTAAAALDDPEEDDDSTKKQSRLQELRRRLVQEEITNTASSSVLKQFAQQSKNSKQSTTTATTTSETTLEHLRSQLAALPQPESPLTDRYRRHHNYLRLSLAEKCNLRCTYCMPEQGVDLSPSNQLLTTNELLQLAEHFVSHGVTKVRLTGGEPTLRSDLSDIIAGLHQMGLQVGMTTNGVNLKHLDDYVQNGLRSINISLDTLNRDKFAKLTRRPPAYFDRVLDNLQRASCISELTTKVNCVVQRNVNDDEIADFIQLTDTKLLPKTTHVRFIEYMPFADNGWDYSHIVPYQELIQSLPFALKPIVSDDPNDTTKWYLYQHHNDEDTAPAAAARIGFITSMSEHFCQTCNRLRLTADGQLKVCLFDETTNISLRDALRSQWSAAELDKLIYYAVSKKKAKLGGHPDPQTLGANSSQNRPMTLIGG